MSKGDNRVRYLVIMLILTLVIGILPSTVFADTEDTSENTEDKLQYELYVSRWKEEVEAKIKELDWHSKRIRYSYFKENPEEFCYIKVSWKPVKGAKYYYVNISDDDYGYENAEFSKDQTYGEFIIEKDAFEKEKMYISIYAFLNSEEDIHVEDAELPIETEDAIAHKNAILAERKAKKEAEAKRLAEEKARHREEVERQKATAEKGWNTIDGYQYYFDKKGHYVTGWKTIKGNKYWFYKNGHICKDKWKTIGRYKYYFDKKGRAAKGWKNIKGKRYWFYKSGRLCRNKWKTVDGYRYRFHKSGRLYRNEWADVYKYVGKNGKEVPSRGRYVKRMIKVHNHYPNGIPKKGQIKADRIAMKIANSVINDPRLKKKWDKVSMVSSYVSLLSSLEFYKEYKEADRYRSCYNAYGLFVVGDFTCWVEAKAEGRVCDYLGYEWQDRYKGHSKHKDLYFKANGKWVRPGEIALTASAKKSKSWKKLDEHHQKCFLIKLKTDYLFHTDKYLDKKEKNKFYRDGSAYKYLNKKGQKKLKKEYDKVRKEIIKDI